MQGLAIQGEIIGEGIQGNQYKRGLEFYVYDIYNTNSICTLLILRVQIYKLFFNYRKNK